MAFISAAIAAVSTFIGGLTWAAVGTFVLKTVASIGLSALAQKLSGKKPKQAAFGVKGQLERGADLPQTFTVGTYATAGSLTYANTAGWTNEFMTWVITLSDLPVASLKGIWVNGEKCTLEPAPGGWLRVVEFTKAPNLAASSRDHLKLRFYDGTQVAPDTWLTDSASTTERPWDASAVGKGKAYVVVQAHADNELFRNGFPNFLFEIEGIPLYDPSQDTSAGGSGVQRWDDRSTWTPSENPAVQLYNVLRGLAFVDGREGGVLADGASIDLTGADTLSFRAVGGGGSAAQPAFGGEQGNNNPAVDGVAGEATTITLKDGATVIQTWTAAGGAGGDKEVLASNGPSQISELSPLGNGADPVPNYIDTTAELSGGEPGAYVEVGGYDISGLTSPNLTIEVGAGASGAQDGGGSYATYTAGAPPVWFYGLQDVGAAQLPVSHWIAQINKCAEDITGADGLESRFRASAEIPVDAEIHSVIESLLDACNGRLSDAGGVYKLFAGAPEDPVMSLTDEDILSTSEQSFTPFLGLADTVNGVSATYPSPVAAWQVETAPPLYRDDYEAEDGGRRLLVDVSLDFVPYAEQAQRLMRAALNEARRARRHTFTLPPKYWPLEPGDVIEWTSARNGYAAKQFRVDGVIDLPNADVIVDLTEVDPADYDFDTNVDFTAPAAPSTVPQPVPVQAFSGFSVAPASIEDADGTGRRPAIRVGWNGRATDVRAVTIEVRVAATGALSDPAHSDTVEEGFINVSAGILPQTEYEVRAKFIPDTPRPTSWSAWATVTTPDLRVSEPDIADQAVTAEKVNVPSFSAAGLAIFGGGLQSDDFDAGVAGWQITEVGDAEFNNLITRNSIVVGEVVTAAIETNAVTLSRESSGTGNQTLSWTPSNNGSAIIIAVGELYSNVAPAIPASASVLVNGVVRRTSQGSTPVGGGDNLSEGTAAISLTWATTANTPITVSFQGELLDASLVILERKR